MCTAINFTISCGGASTGMIGYNVTGSGFQLLDAANTNVQTFAKQ